MEQKSMLGLCLKILGAVILLAGALVAVKYFLDGCLCFGDCTCIDDGLDLDNLD